ncbi:MAG: integrase family protein, partial [Cellvibrio sp.]|nr:integrase family protein [Cellvibrio sp.]
MAVDKLKSGFPLSLDDTNLKIIVSNNWKDPLVVAKDADIPQSERVALDKQMDEIFTTEVHQRLGALLEFSHLYEVDSYQEAVDAELFLQHMIKRFNCPANEKREFTEGKSIYDITKQLMNLYARVKRIEQIPDMDSLSTSSMYEITEILMFRELGRLAKTFSASDKWYARYIQDLTSVLYQADLIKLDKLKPIPPKLPSYLEKAKPMAEASSAPLFSTLFDEFLAHKIANKLSDKLRKNYRADFPVFLHFIGDKPIDKIVRRDVRACLLSCLKFPRRNLRPYLEVPVAKLATMEVPESDWLSDRSVLNFKKLLQGIFAYAKEQEYIKESP